MRVALISDLHGNAVALRAVLQELEGARVDRLVCLGDVATLGPEPHAVLSMLEELGCACIRGNHDDFLLEPELVQQYTDAAVVRDAVLECGAALRADELAFVRGFLPGLDLDLEHATLGLFHGSPRSNTEDLLATTPDAELEAALGKPQAGLLAGGHTHIQMVRSFAGKQLINPGSVGLCFESFANHGPPRVLPFAEYAIIDAAQSGVTVQLHRTRLSVSALNRALVGWDNPMRAFLEGQYAS